MRDIVSDLALAAAVLVGAGLLFVGASDLPPPRFEPMGSAALPRILASLLVLFAIVLGIGALRRYLRGTTSKPLEPLSSSPSITDSRADTESDAALIVDNADAGNKSDIVGGGSAIRAAVLFAALAGYVFALDKLQWPFVLVSTVFVTFVGTLLSKPALRSLIVFFAFGLALSYSVHSVFTRFLYVDLG